jgi:hypothetical protein
MKITFLNTAPKNIILLFLGLFIVLFLIIGFIRIKKNIPYHSMLTSRITINVINKEGWPIAGTKVVLSSNHCRFIKNSENFNPVDFEIPPGIYKMSITKEGYKSFEETLNISTSSITGKFILLAKSSDKEPSRVISFWQGLPSEWNEYQNLVTGFAIKYPASWKIDEYPYSEGTIFNLYERGKEKLEERIGTLEIYKKSSYSEVEERYLTIKEIVSENVEELKTHFPNLKIEEIFLGNISATKLHYTDESSGTVFDRIFLQKEGEITSYFQIETIIFSFQKMEDYSPIVYEVLSTFKFIEHF